MDREISPPLIKRQRMTHNATEVEQIRPVPSIRLFSWNVNGMAPFIQKPITSFFTSDKANQAQPHASLRDFIRRQGFPTLLFLQEVKINPSDSASQSAVSRAIKRDASEPDTNPDYVAHFSLPHDDHNATGFGRKVYGVCSIVRKDFADQYVERMRTVDWDAEGRFSVIETKAGLDVPKLAIFNVYMVNGTDNPYKDSETGVVTGTRHTRKLAVHRLLQAEIRRLEHDGYQAIIAGDINIAVSKIDGHPNLRCFPHQHVLNREDFTRRFLGKGKFSELDSKHSRTSGKVVNDGLDMADTFRLLHPDEKGHSYYPRGKIFGESCDRVDMILCSHSLATSCIEAGVLATAADRGTSDHVPIHSAFKFPEQANLGPTQPQV
jgi:exonuclease III